MLKEEEVLQGFFAGVCCSMQVFGEAAREQGFDEATARRIASCFGSGMERAGLCGCVTGAYMALGLKYGNGAPGEADKIALLKEKKAEFERRLRSAGGASSARRCSAASTLRAPRSSKPRSSAASFSPSVRPRSATPARY